MIPNCAADTNQRKMKSRKSSAAAKMKKINDQSLFCELVNIMADDKIFIVSRERIQSLYSSTRPQPNPSQHSSIHLNWT